MGHTSSAASKIYQEEVGEFSWPMKETRKDKYRCCEYKWHTQITKKVYSTLYHLAFDDCINVGLKKFMWGSIHLESILHLVLQRKNQPRFNLGYCWNVWGGNLFVRSSTTSSKLLTITSMSWSCITVNCHISKTMDRILQTTLKNRCPIFQRAVQRGIFYYIYQQQVACCCCYCCCYLKCAATTS